MKHVYRLLSFALLGLAMAGCTVTVIPDPVSVTNLSLSSAYRDAWGDDAICDDTITDLQLDFRHGTPLQSWTVSIRGQRGGETYYNRTFFPNSDGVSYGASHVSTQFRLPAYLTATDSPRLDASAIVVRPKPVTLEHVDLWLAVEGEFGEREIRRLYGIPVVTDCF